MRNDVIIRVARLLLLLRGRRQMPTFPWLAMHLECSSRTVRRYVDALEVAGYPLPQRAREDWE